MKLSSHVIRSLLLLGAGAGSATAAPILWSLPAVVLQGCCIVPLNEQQAVLFGAFTFDPQTQTYSDWNFDISGYTEPLAPLNGILTPDNSTIVVGGATILHLTYASNQADLVLTFGYLSTFGLVQVPLSPFGGDVPVLITNSPRFASFFANSPGLVSAIPEPVAGVLVLVGAAILCLWKPGRFRRNERKP